MAATGAPANARTNRLSATMFGLLPREPLLRKHEVMDTASHACRYKKKPNDHLVVRGARTEHRCRWQIARASDTAPGIGTFSVDTREKGGDGKCYSLMTPTKKFQKTTFLACFSMHVSNVSWSWVDALWSQVAVRCEIARQHPASGIRCPCQPSVIRG